MKKPAILSLCLVFTAGAIGCGADEQEDAALEEPIDAVQPLEGDTTPGAAAATRVPVALSEWTVRPERDTLSPGRVTFTVTNEGQHEHALEVEGQGEEWETDPIPAGGTATLTVDLEPGTYELYCPVESEEGAHQQLGMTTDITVR